MKILRDYQDKLKNDTYLGWNAGHRNILAVSPTGSGKTETWAEIFRELAWPGLAIAHRQELVAQISCAFAGRGIYHRIIAPDPVIHFVVGQHIKKFGRSFYHHNAPIGVTGVDTFLKRHEQIKQWVSQLKVWGIDEGHHVLVDNKWGKAVKIVNHALGVGFTATPTRTDRKALGASAGTGVYHHMVLGPTPRELINRGHLADYKIYGPKASIDRSKIEISKATGELNESQTRKEAHKSKITGDIVKHYLDFAPGKRGITFTVDVELANDAAAAFNNAGIPAMAVSAKTKDSLRTSAVEKLERGELLQLINVDLFGEGFDVPAVEVVSMGRPTASFGLYVQQFGRALRPAEGKTHGIIIDHVDNVVVHKLPDKPRVWSLDAIDRTKTKKTNDDAMPVRSCTACYRSYEATSKVCPYCGHKEEPAGRGSPEFVDGDLTEYGEELLARMRGEQQWVDGPVHIPMNVNEITAAAIRRNHSLRQEAHQELRDAIAYWAGIQRDVYNRTDSESYRRFYFTFGVDCFTAVTLRERAQVVKLTEQIRETFV